MTRPAFVRLCSILAALALETGAPHLRAQLAEVAPVSAPASPAAAGSSSPRTIRSFLGPNTYVNGPLVTQIGVGFGGADVSEVTAPSMTFGMSAEAGATRLADDFFVPPGETWAPQTLRLYAYETNSSTTSTITGATVQIWLGTAGHPGSLVIAGDTTTNRPVQASFSNIYRVSAGLLNNTQRPIMELEVDVSWVGPLAAGHYSVDFQLSGSASLTGPWAPPVTPTPAGANARQYSYGSGSWIVSLDGGLGAEAPFELDYFQFEGCGIPAEHSSAAGPSLPVPASGTGGGGTWPDTLPPSPTIVQFVVPCPVNCIDRITLHNFQHTHVGDLHIALRSPTGVLHNVFVRPGSVNGTFGWNTDFLGGGDVDFLDPSTLTLPPIQQANFGPGAYPQLFGSATPAGTVDTPLSGISGPAGTWSLEIYDWASVDTGSIDGVTIHCNGCRTDEVVLACDITNSRLVSFSSVDGRVVNPSVFSLPPTTSPFHAIQVGAQIWISLQSGDRIQRYSLDGTLLGEIGPTFPGGGIDSGRGLARVGNTVYLVNQGSNNGAPGAAILRFDKFGAYLGATPVSATSATPTSLLEHNGDLLLTSAAGDDVHRYTLGVASLGVFHNSSEISAAQQVARAANGNILCMSAFNSRIVELDGSTGAWVSSTPVSPTLPQGLFPLANGKVLWSALSNAYVYDSVVGGSSLVKSGSFRQFSLYEALPTEPIVYCTAGTTTNGCVPAISANALPNVTNTAGCVVSVANLEGQKQGLIFYGVNNNGFTPNPWGAGSSFTCVKAPTQRTGSQNSGGIAGLCNGSFGILWDSYQSANSSALGNPFAPGDRVYVQAWFRDPAAPKTTNLSDALELTYLP